MADETTILSPEIKQNPILTVPDDLVPEAWKDHVRDLRRENQTLRAAGKSNTDDVEKRIQDLSKKYSDEADLKVTAAHTAANERLLRSELKAEAIKAGMVDLDGLKLADLSKVKLNDSGEVEGADALMTDLKKAKPYLFGAVGTTSNPAGSMPKAGEQKQKLAPDMTKEEYAAARADIRRGIVPKFTA